MDRLRVLLPLLATFNSATISSCFTVLLASDGPAVRGSNVTLTATVLDYDGEELSYSWLDTAQPQHRADIVLTSDSCNWTVSYPRELYEAGEYKVKLVVRKRMAWIWYTVGGNDTYFNITNELNGEMSLSQNSTKRPNEFVAVNVPVKHTVDLTPVDLKYLKENASLVTTHWFIDCNYIDKTTDYSFNYTYNDLMKDHAVDALIVANNQPLPPLLTTTTTTTTTTTLKPRPVNITTESPTENTAKVSTEIPKDKSFVHNKVLAKREVSSHGGVGLPSTFSCPVNLPIDPKNIYGHYRKTIGIREPVSNVSVSGNNWLPHGDLLRLQAKCQGSPPFSYCTEYIQGSYNASGNETCKSVTTVDSCNFPLVHYFSTNDAQTLLIILGNELGTSVSQFTINVYKVEKTGQLSVIVVPVVFCLLAAILVVFGVAYYIQSRSRFTVEVADFDFGQQYSHLDYKTFMERLRDSFNNAFNLPTDDDGPSPSTSNNKYGSMT